MCDYGISNFKSAAKFFKKALKIYPDDPNTHYKLALTYLKLNKIREARKKLNILYMLNNSLYDSLDNQINKFQ